MQNPPIGTRAARPVRAIHGHGGSDARQPVSPIYNTTTCLTLPRPPIWWMSSRAASRAASARYGMNEHSGAGGYPGRAGGARKWRVLLLQHGGDGLF